MATSSFRRRNQTEAQLAQASAAETAVAKVVKERAARKDSTKRLSRRIVMASRKLDHRTWSLISPSVARLFRVIPLKQNKTCIRMLTDQDFSSDEDRRNAERQLTLRLCGKVRLETLKTRRDWKAAEFQAILDRYYSIDFDRMTVLLLDPEDSRAHHYLDVMKQRGHRFLHARTLAQAERLATSRRWKLDMVLIASERNEDFEKARRQLEKLVLVPIVSSKDLYEGAPEQPGAGDCCPADYAPRNGTLPGK